MSKLNRCVFCAQGHGATADYHAQQPGLSREVCADPEHAPISERLRAQLRIAAKVASDAASVTQSDVECAKALGATEREVHDTVLIAAAFCMYNRYVDGLAATTPPAGDPSYAQTAKLLAERGYGAAG